jgi:hypothetical protein
MIQTSNAVPIQTQPATDLQDSTLLDPLLRLAGDIKTTHTLIIADHALDLMCGLIRRGCLAATMLRPGDTPDADDYDLVLVPYAAALLSQDDVIRLARRSLAPRGRLIVGVRNGKAATELARRLRLNGFTNLRSTHLEDRTLLRADLRSLA